MNFAVSSNAFYEALGLVNAVDHPHGFKTGITVGLELRSQQEIVQDDKPFVAPDNEKLPLLSQVHEPKWDPSTGHYKDRMAEIDQLTDWYKQQAQKSNNI